MTAWNDSDYHANPQTVQPFEAANVNPASYDLRLGDTLRRVHPIWETLRYADMLDMCNGDTLPQYAAKLLTDDEWQAYVTARFDLEALPKWGPAEQFDNAWLMPGEFVLCSSLEIVTVPDDCLALLFSKSSTGRVGLEHLHAGLGDPAFDGNWTWELHNVAPWPTRLQAGKRLMQHVFIRLSAAPLRNYAETGRYQGQRGPTPARGER